MEAFSRRLVSENRLSTDDLILPLFVIEGDKKTEMIDTMPGVARYSIDRLIEQAQQADDLGLPAIAIFPSIEATLKDKRGSLAEDSDNLVCRAVKAVKSICPELGIICDVALDPFTDHGHDGLLQGNQILNDETLEILCRQAIHQAKDVMECDAFSAMTCMDNKPELFIDKLGFCHGDGQLFYYLVNYSLGEEIIEPNDLGTILL